MKKPTLFLDFDGLKFDTISAHMEYMNARYNIPSIITDYANNPSLELVVRKYITTHPITREEAYKDLSDNFLQSLELHEVIQPFEGMCEVVKELSKKYSLWTVTARQKSGLHVIEHLLNKHVPECISGIHCVSEHLGKNKYNEISKRSFIENFEGAKVAFIDDSAHEIKLVQDIIPVYLFDPLGMNDHDTSITHRIRNWEEIGNIFL